MQQVFNYELFNIFVLFFCFFFSLCFLSILLRDKLSLEFKSDIKKNLINNEFIIFFLSNFLFCSMILYLSDFSLKILFISSLTIFVLYYLVYCRLDETPKDIIGVKIIISFWLSCHFKGLGYAFFEFVGLFIVCYIVFVIYQLFFYKEKEKNEYNTILTHLKKDFVLLDKAYYLSLYYPFFFTFYVKNNAFLLNYFNNLILDLLLIVCCYLLYLTFMVFFLRLLIGIAFNDPSKTKEILGLAMVVVPAGFAGLTYFFQAQTDHVRFPGMKSVYGWIYGVKVNSSQDLELINDHKSRNPGVNIPTDSTGAVDSLAIKTEKAIYLKNHADFVEEALEREENPLMIGKLWNAYYKSHYLNSAIAEQNKEDYKTLVEETAKRLERVGIGSKRARSMAISFHGPKK